MGERARDLLPVPCGDRRHAGGRDRHSRLCLRPRTRRGRAGERQDRCECGHARQAGDQDVRRGDGHGERPGSGDRRAPRVPASRTRAGPAAARYAGGHEAFRAWYCSTWVGGDPKVEVTHDVAGLQAHPLFFRCWKGANDDFRTVYQDDAYKAWSAERLNVPSMPAGGDIEALGPLTQWDARYLQTGSRYVRRAVVATALGALSCNINARDRSSGRIPRMRRRTARARTKTPGRRRRPSPRGRSRTIRRSA